MELEKREKMSMPKCFRTDPFSMLSSVNLEDESTPFSVVEPSAPSQPVQVNVDNTLSRVVEADAGKAVVKLLSRSVKMPWESNPVLCPKRSFSVFQPRLEQMAIGLKDFIHDSSVRAEQPSHASMAFSQSLKRARLAQRLNSSDDLRFKSLSLVKWMLTSDMSSTNFGQLLLQQGASQELINQSLQDALASKASATLYKRARALWEFFTWMRALGHGSGLDFTEPLVYTYLCKLRSDQRGATSGEAMLQAIRFFHAVFGLVHFNPNLASSRVRGVAHAMFVQKRSLQQARSLYVPELRGLEQVVLHEQNPYVAIIAGYLLFCVMAVCRFSDAMFVNGFSLSSHHCVTILEAGTSVHKTAHTKERKTMLLPLVALGSVFDKTSWAARWVELRSQYIDVGCKYSLPAFSEATGNWLSRPMTTGEGILWLRDIVSIHCSTGECLTTHSLKTTLLSWATLMGVMNFDQRRTLGHHVDAHTASPLTYGRDNVVQLQVIVFKMLKQIGAGEWDPDLPRAARLFEELRATLTDLDDADERMVFEVPDGSEGAHDDPSDVEPAVDYEDAVDDTGLNPKVFISAAKADSRLLQHNSSGVLHFIGLDNKFMCGRRINAFYSAITFDLNNEWPIC